VTKTGDLIGESALQLSPPSVPDGAVMCRERAFRWTLFSPTTFLLGVSEEAGGETALRLRCEINFITEESGM
jgi:hypothetical protein